MVSFTDPSWIRPHLPVSEEERETATIAFASLPGNGGGLSGAFRRIIASWPGTDKPPKVYIFKTALADTLDRSKLLGNPREAFFYETLAPVLAAANVPTVETIFSEGDNATGARTVVMEDLGDKGIQSGLLFGPLAPLNLRTDVAASIAHLPQIYSPIEVAAKTFVEAAKMHRMFWLDETLLSHSWLRGCEWLVGANQESWTAVQSYGASNWQRVTERILAGTCTVEWDRNLFECIEQSLQNIDWNNYQQELQSRPWTLVHGDFHAGNVMWMFNDEAASEPYPLFVDWEMVGLGSGPQEIAQYLITHLSPEDRRDCEDKLLHIYYDTLTCPQVAGCASLTPETYSFEACKRHFVEGGMRRWLWFMTLLAEGCPNDMTQSFHDRAAAFAADHRFTKENVGMPRV